MYAFLKYQVWLHDMTMIGAKTELKAKPCRTRQAHALTQDVMCTVLLLHKSAMQAVYM